LFNGWHDSLEGVDCRFGLAADGVVRCLPSVSTIEYADAACTKPVVVGSPSCSSDVPRYATPDVSFDACHPVGLELHSVGASLGMGTSYRLGPDGCMQQGQVPQFAVGEIVDPTRFVAQKTRAKEERGGGLAVTVVTADDGAKEIVEFVDDARGVCIPQGVGTALVDTALPCIAGLGFEGKLNLLYSDASCTTFAPAFFNDQTCTGAPPAAIVTQTQLGTCSFEYTLHLPGPPIDAPLYSKGATCAAPTFADFTQYELGPVAKSTDFPILQATKLGTGQLRALYWGDSKDRPLSPQSFVDSANGSSCSLVSLASDPGTIRCLSDSYLQEDAVPLVYADAACTVPGFFAATGPCAGSTPPTVVSDITFNCSAVGRLTKLDALVAHSGPIYEKTTGTCLEKALPPDTTAYELGAPIPFESLPLITTRTE
jgi:hypothetical protein